MTGGEIFGLAWLAVVVVLFAWYGRADCQPRSRGRGDLCHED